MPLKRALLITAIILGLAAACGPSIRRTYQSDNAFARCFDMDYNPAAAASDKEVCWDTWLDTHVYNQREDKIRYARLRLEELANGVSVPGPPGPPGAFDKRPAKRPKSGVRMRHRKGPPAGESQPIAECEGPCKKSLATCRESCRVDGGVDDFCQKACEESHKTCMKECFGE